MVVCWIKLAKLAYFNTMTILFLILLEFAGDFNVNPHEFEYVFKKASELTATIHDPYRGSRVPDGQCLPWSKTIILNEDHWVTLNRWQQRELVYHELGHCVFDLDHVAGSAIMNPFAKGGYHVKRDGSNWPQLVAGLRRRIAF